MEDAISNLPLGTSIAGGPYATLVPLVAAGPGREPASGFDGEESLSGAFLAWAGGPPEWAPEVAWQSEEDAWGEPFDPDVPRVVVSWGAGTTSGVEPGSYLLLLKIGDAEAYLGHHAIVPGADPDAALSPTPLISAAEFRERIASWPESLQSSATGAGLRKTLSLATADLYEHIATRHAVGWRHSPYHCRAEAESEMLAALNTGTSLTVTHAIRDYVAARALVRLLEFQATAKDDKGGHAALVERAKAAAGAALGRVVAVVEGFDCVVAFGGGGPKRVERG